MARLLVGDKKYVFNANYASESDLATELNPERANAIMDGLIRPANPTEAELDVLHDRRVYLEMVAEEQEFLEDEKTGNWARQDGPYQIVKQGNEFVKLYQLQPGETTFVFLPA